MTPWITIALIVMYVVGCVTAAVVVEAWVLAPLRVERDRYRVAAIKASEHLKQVKRELGQRRLADLKAGAPSSTIDLFDNDQWSKRADLRVAGGPKRNRAV